MLTNSTQLDILLLFSSVIFCLLYIFFTRNFNYWKRRGIPYKKPLPLVGNFLQVVRLKKNFAEVLAELYFETNAPYLGIFIADKPALLIKDLELSRNILVRDFQNFTDNSFANRAGNISEYMVPFMKGKDWKLYRKFNTPAFGRSTLKSVYFELINEAADELIEYLDTRLNDNENLINCKRLTEGYSAEMLTSIALGVKGNCFRNENSKILKMAHDLFNFISLKRGISIAAYLLYPRLVNLLSLNLIDPISESEFKKLFFQSVLKRKENGNPRNDLVGILMNWRREERENIKLDDDKMVAQAITFFLAAFEGITNVAVMALYELAANLKIQTRLREEIREYLNHSENSNFTFEAVFSELKYLDMVIKETLRKYPPVAVFNRECTIDYRVPSTNFLIEKGTTLFIPSFAIQNDPEYFPNPDIFDPERFSECNNHKIKPGTYMPFSDGSRGCMGEKIGLVSVKVAVARIIQNYQVDLRDDSQRKMKIDPKAYVLGPDDEKVIFKFKKV